ncbi:hypothetical protein [Paenibacillus agaridevorans]|uniref:hypothetical protein n=1 Tax=Paenibacillus agaridevorans TaxID=171404 RepID=UPI001BE44CDF|nr:hypothetical protein [Paenibacillus agaridevorans]
MKKSIILIMLIALLILSACTSGNNNQINLSPQNKANVDGSSENNAVQEANESVDSKIKIDDQITGEVVDVIQNHILAVHTNDEELVKSTVLKDLDFDERVYALWNDSLKEYKLEKLDYGHGDENNEVVTVTFINDVVLSFAVTKTSDGWKLYDID